MIKHTNVYLLQKIADKQGPRAKEIIQDAIHELCELRDTMRKINAAALDTLTEPAELQHFPGGGFGQKLPPLPKRLTRQTSGVRIQPSKNAESDYVKRA